MILMILTNYNYNRYLLLNNNSIIVHVVPQQVTIPIASVVNINIFSFLCKNKMKG